MNREQIAEKLKALIEDQNDITIADADDALDIDSFTMMLVILFVKEEIGVELDVDQMDFDSFKSLNVFATLILDTAEANGIRLSA